MSRAISSTVLDPTDVVSLLFDHRVYKSHPLGLPERESTAPEASNPELEDELRALSLDEEFYRVIGDRASAGVVVSRPDEPVEFARSLSNRVVSLVPIADVCRVPRWGSEEAQTVGIHPDRLREELRDDLVLHGAQRALLHDGTEPMRRMVRWVVDQSADVR